MKMFKALFIMAITVTIALTAFACSKGVNPTEPLNSNDSAQLFGEQFDSRNLIAVYQAEIDPVAGTFSVEPTERVNQYHFPLTSYYPGVLQITGYGWTPNFWANVKLQHPYPGTGIDGFDARVIAILPANPGVSFNYLALDAHGNNSAILEPDGYTRLFDWIGGSMAGNINPFRAYFKDQPNRVWSGTGVTEETQTWQMDISGFGGPLSFYLVVDVSTNYPNPPQPIIDNAPEPVQIDALIGNGLTDLGGVTSVDVAVLDWQGPETIGEVHIEAPALFGNTMPLAFYSYGTITGMSYFKGTIANDNLAPAGTYQLMIKAWDAATGIAMFNEFDAEVIEE